MVQFHVSNKGGQSRLRTEEPLATESAQGQTSRHRAYRFTLAAIRLSVGWVFLWAFLDKTFGLGYATPAAKAWINGGSPTAGFLGHVEGPFADFYHSFAGAGWANWLFMIGLVGIGTALILGVAMRAAAVAGVTLLVLMWTAVLPLTNNPFLDDHLHLRARLGSSRAGRRGQDPRSWPGLGEHPAGRQAQRAEVTGPLVTVPGLG